MNTKKKWNYITEGERAYQELLGGILGSPERRERYEEEATKLDLWLQLVRARQDAELTQAELAKRRGLTGSGRTDREARVRGVHPQHA